MDCVGLLPSSQVDGARGTQTFIIRSFRNGATELALLSGDAAVIKTMKAKILALVGMCALALGGCAYPGNYDGGYPAHSGYGPRYDAVAPGYYDFYGDGYYGGLYGDGFYDGFYGDGFYGLYGGGFYGGGYPGFHGGYGHYGYGHGGGFGHGGFGHGGFGNGGIHGGGGSRGGGFHGGHH